VMLSPPDLNVLLHHDGNQRRRRTTKSFEFEKKNAMLFLSIGSTYHPNWSAIASLRYNWAAVHSPRPFFFSIILYFYKFARTFL
jgi:hypothetical protein